MTSRKELTEIHFGPLWFLPGDNYGIYPYCHSLYIEGPGILIDPGSNRERLMEIRQDPGVNEVWLSHFHEDHFLNLDLFDDLPLKTSEPEARVMGDIELFLDAYDTPAEHRHYWKELFIEQFRFKPRNAAGFLRGGETVRAGDVTIEIISAPGHTPGHTAFFFREQAVLFLGDYDLSRFGPWYGDRNSSIEETIASVNMLRGINADVWITAHETGIYEDEPGAAWDEYLDVIRRRDEKILDLLDRPMNLEDLMAHWIIYGKPKEPRVFFELGERLHIGKHLERLLKKGAVKRVDGKFVKPDAL
ncbi:MAG: MBL fold metallo-hydrolase [Deltaproteobacteria bacterium CG_4_8_14_3_um_filter_51_11]|nr:MBL fold metallo-hydrolase [Deltaproteobacteria bacterium]PIX19295.1 MAG: MBL fold metallo-hydrolase [Deltaproteobacteria bacterium CG_4_8_14_3_um_filter_51_11]